MTELPRDPHPRGRNRKPRAKAARWDLDEPISVQAISDLHGYLPKISLPSDLLLIAGDIVPWETHEGLERQAQWLNTTFRAWLEQVPAREIIGIAGNHDWVFESERLVGRSLVPDDLPWTYLEDTTVERLGLKIHGSPWTPWLNDWAFNAPRKDGEEFLAEKYEAIPAGTDILICHGPPRGIGDLNEDREHVGSTALLDTIDRVQPAACIWGHVHEAAGGPWQRGRARLANVSIMDERYRAVRGAARFGLSAH